MATNKPQDDYKKTALRLPPGLHERLHEAAAASGRSYNAEIVERLESSFSGCPSLLDGKSEEVEQLRGELLALIERKRRNEEVIAYLKESGLPAQEIQLAFSKEWSAMGPRAMVIAQRMRELGEADAVKQISKRPSKKIASDH